MPATVPVTQHYLYLLYIIERHHISAIGHITSCSVISGWYGPYHSSNRHITIATACYVRLAMQTENVWLVSLSCPTRSLLRDTSIQHAPYLPLPIHLAFGMRDPPLYCAYITLLCSTCRFTVMGHDSLNIFISRVWVSIKKVGRQCMPFVLKLPI